MCGKLIDYHCHILPGIDDGSDSVETSVSMVKMMKEQGVEKIIATPHFYAHREKGIENYIGKRQKAFDSLIDAKPEILDISLGSEVAIERGICEIDGLEKLSIGQTGYILLELPYAPFKSWYLEEIDNVSSSLKLKVILAHIHRYLDYYKKDEMEQILELDTILQVNNEAFEKFKERSFVKKLFKQERKIVFGSDSHNLNDRKPNWDILQKKCKAEYIEKSNMILG